MTTPSAGRSVRHRIGQLAILHEGRIVEQQGDPIAYEELVRNPELGRRSFCRREGTVPRSTDAVHDRLLHRKTQPAGDQQPLHLRGAFPDLQDLCIPIEAGDRILLHESVAAEYLGSDPCCADG